MAPPKCFFKRPDQFYTNGELAIEPPKLEFYAIPTSPITSTESSPSIKEEPISLCRYNQLFTPISRNAFASEPMETPLDLSCKNSSVDILNQLGNFLLQHQHQLSTTNIGRLFSLLPPQGNPSIQPSCLTSDIRWNSTTQNTDPLHLSVDRIRDFNRRHSPQSLSESLRDNSSSETSSLYATSTPRSRNNHKRRIDSKVFRPFKLYKGNDSRSLMEALAINEEDEQWLKSMVEHKSVDDVFLFLTNCMNESTKLADVSDDVIEKIQSKFGHIFQNCNTSVSNPRMIRHPDMTPIELKTDEYWEKRRKNNDAAKRSREARRHKEDRLNQHCDKLQTENDSLRKEIERVKFKIDEIKQTIC